MKQWIFYTSRKIGPGPTATATSHRAALLALLACLVACGAMSVFGVRAYTVKKPNISPAPSSTTRMPNTADKLLVRNSAEPAIRDSLDGPETSGNKYSPSARVTQQAATNAKLTDSVLITITPGGFDVGQITSPAVPFFLLVENRSGLDEVSLRLDRVAGPRLRQVTVAREQLDWSDLMDLSPGEYVLSEGNHPSWTCHITITSK